MAYDKFISDAVTHPQMLRLQQLLLGSEHIRFDHNTLLTRRAFAGQHWHSHSYVEDNFGPTARPGGAALGLTRCLIYPDGFHEEDDGGLRVVPGGHQWRMSQLRDGYTRAAPPGPEDDAHLEQT